MWGWGVGVKGVFRATDLKSLGVSSILVCNRIMGKGWLPKLERAETPTPKKESHLAESQGCSIRKFPKNYESSISMKIFREKKPAFFFQEEVSMGWG